MLDGVFSFVLLDTRHGSGSSSFLAARDAIGVTPLYIGWGIDGTVVSVCTIHICLRQCRYQCN
jgi:asparagine synthase (glutamine-hydrolysing)